MWHVTYDMWHMTCYKWQMIFKILPVVRGEHSPNRDRDSGSMLVANNYRHSYLPQEVVRLSWIYPKCELPPIPQDLENVGDTFDWDTGKGLSDLGNNFLLISRS